MSSEAFSLFLGRGGTAQNIRREIEAVQQEKFGNPVVCIFHAYTVMFTSYLSYLPSFCHAPPRSKLTWTVYYDWVSARARALRKTN